MRVDDQMGELEPQDMTDLTERGYARLQSGSGEISRLAMRFHARLVEAAPRQPMPVDEQAESIVDLAVAVAEMCHLHISQQDDTSRETVLSLAQQLAVHACVRCGFSADITDVARTYVREVMCSDGGSRWAAQESLIAGFLAFIAGDERGLTFAQPAANCFFTRPAVH